MPLSGMPSSYGSIEAALPASQREGLEKLRAQFPDIPIEYGDTSKFDAAHGL